MFETLRRYEINSKALKMIEYQMSGKGKRLRPAIVVSVCNTLGGNTADSFSLAIAIEIIHNASLVHDDVEDKDELRRDKYSLWKVFSEEQAINVGDLMFALGLQIFMDSKLEEHRKFLIIREINKSVIGITNGQILDVDQKQNAIHDLDEYFEMIDGKTGALFVLAFVGGGLTAKIPTHDEYLKLTSIGLTFGRLFQIRDDLIDALGLKEGRKAGRDIVEGKMSLPTVLALEKLNKNEKARLLEIHKMSCELKNDELIKEALALYDRADVFSDIRKMYSDYETQLIKLSSFNSELSKFIDELLKSLKINY